jgi:hypothetical protein
MDDAVIFYGHLVYFMANWYILWPFGIFYGHLVYFMAFWYILWPIGIFYGQLVHFTATCFRRHLVLTINMKLPIYSSYTYIPTYVCTYMYGLNDSFVFNVK